MTPYWRGLAVGVVLTVGGVAHDVITWSRGRIVAGVAEAGVQPGAESFHGSDLQVNKVAQVMDQAARVGMAADDATGKLDELSSAWATRIAGQR